jgi:hypothetical protein
MAITAKGRAAPAVGSPAHTRLVALIRSRRQLAERQLGRWYPDWRAADRIYQHYVDPDQVDRDGKRIYPWARDIVVPLTFAIVQTQVAWEMAAFTQRVPIVPLDGVSPEDVKPSKLMEQVLHHEWTAERMSLALYQWLLDRRRYGLGILWVNYVRDMTRQWVEREETLDLPGLGVKVPIGHTAGWETRATYEGNRLEPIDPFAFYPDPRVSVGECHRGEFVGYRTTRHYHDLLLKQGDGQYANVEQIPKRRRRALSWREGGQGAPESSDASAPSLGAWLTAGGVDTVDGLDGGLVELDIMVIRLIPKDYELGPSTQPEKYVAVLANDATIVRARPYEYQHDELPAAVIELTPDRHHYATPGTVEHIEDLQTYLSWLYNSHAVNVRRVLNNQFIVDPAVIELEDLLAPQPGLLARLRREWQGRPGALDSAVKQLPMVDVTKSHFSDMDFVINMMQRVAAAPENLQGITGAGDRTLGEQQMAVSAAQGRLRLDAQLAWLQGMTRVTHQRIANIQQYMTEQKWIQVVGTYPRALGMVADQKFLRVGPEEIQGNFTYAQPDMIVRHDRDVLMALREIWMAVAKEPELRQRFDLVKLFEPMAMMAGIKNLDDYTRELPASAGQVPIPGLPSFGMPTEGGGTPPGQPPPGPGPMQPRVRPDEDVMRQVEQGNLVPMPMGMGS